MYQYMLVEFYKGDAELRNIYCKSIDDVRATIRQKPKEREAVHVYELNFIYSDNDNNGYFEY